MNHYEFTGETRKFGGLVLNRIRATRDIPIFCVKAGDLGGWIESERNLGGSAWVSGDARVSGNAWVFGDAWVSGNAWVSGDAQVFGDARVSGDAWVSGIARVFGDAQVLGVARIGDSALVYGNALIERPDHVLTVAPIGSEDVTATLFRTADGHKLSVGCWVNGTLETLDEEVEYRAKYWPGSDLDHEVWRAQYKALRELGMVTVLRWEQREMDTTNGETK